MIPPATVARIYLQLVAYAIIGCYGDWARAASRPLKHRKENPDGTAPRYPSRDRHQRRCPAQRGLLRRAAGPAAGQEDGQLRRPGLLPPLLRRRAGPAGLRDDVLRLARRPGRPPGP